MRPHLSLLFLSFVASAPTHAADPRGDNPDAPSSTPQEQLAKFHVPPGFEVQLVAAEPQLQKPINITFDAAGRLWVTGSELYPWPASVDALGQLIPGFDKGYADIAAAFRAGDKAPPISNVARDTVRVLSDFSPDGAARKIQVFADGLNVPSGVQPLPRRPGAKGDTVIVYSIPNIWRMEDTDGDGKADTREVLYGFFGYLDTHGGSSSYLSWIDGWIYGTHGFRNHSEVRDRAGKTVVLESGNTYRFRPDGSAFEIYTHGQTNPFGLTVDPLGNFYSADSHSKPVYMLLRGGYYEGIGKQHDGLGFAPRITDDDHGSSAIAGIAYYADDKFPEEFRGNLFNGNPVTQKINRDKLEWHGATPKAIRQPDFLTCDDPWFRPVQVKLGPDGALYIADFYNPIIGHYEFPLTDPRRDHTHGRIWRVVWRGEKKDAPITELPDLTVLSSNALVEKLSDANLEVRRLATNELAALAGPSRGAAEETLARALGDVFTQGSPTARVHALSMVAQVEANRAGPETQEKIDAEFVGSILKDSPSPVVSALTRFLADKPTIDGPMTESFTEALTARTADANLQLALAEFVSRHPTETGLNYFVHRLAAPDHDPTDVEVAYAYRMGIRDILKSANGFAWAKAMIATDRAPEILADAAVAVPTPESAEFILGHLERTKLETPRAGEYLKHTLLNLPPDKLDSAMNLVGEANTKSALQKLTLATSFSEGTRQRGLTPPPAMATWSQGVILDALATKDDALAKTAIATVRDWKLDAKLAPLAAIVGDPARDGALRLAALEAAANLPASKDLLTATFTNQGHMILRKRAAELLAQNGLPDAIVAALPSAPDELATSIAGALVKTDAGATVLLALIDTGKISPRLLLSRSVSGPLTARPKPLRDRVAALVKDLPPEDARLNGVIAERAAAFAKAQPNTAHGAQVFQTNCAICHRYRNAGGNVGPNLDGVVARGPARLIEDILDPNRNVDPLFRQTTIETTDGQTLIGGNLRDQGTTLLLADPTGKDITVEKTRIKKQTISPLSLMPPVFETALPPQDFYDLLAFLLTPTPSPQ